MAKKKCRKPIKNAPDECQLPVGHEGEHVGVNCSESEWCEVHKQETLACLDPKWAENLRRGFK